MSSNKKIKIGWIGSGFVGQVAHLNLYEDISNAEIVALSELRQSLGKKVAKKNFISNYYKNYTEMLNSEVLDGVVLIVHRNHTAHFAEDILKKKFNLFTEKPQAPTFNIAKKLVSIAKKNNLWVLEDCAQAHFATYNGKTVGTFGDAATFSFYPGKNLGAMGDAGAVVTSNDKLADQMKLFARHGGKGEHLIEGINSRMDGLQAAVLNIKLSKMDEWTDKRTKAAQYYDDLLQSIPSVALPIEKSGNKHVYHLYVIKVPKRDELKEYLEASGIQTVVNYPKALPFYKAYEYLEHLPQDFPVAYENQSKILSLPIHPFITGEEQEYVTKKIRDFY